MAGGFLAFRCHNFDHTAEREQFRLLCKKLKKQYARSDEYCLFIANYNVFDCELDSLLIKNDAIIAIEFKNYGGKIIASENGEWTSDGKSIKGGSRKTVYQQAKINHIALRNGLNELGINPQWIKDIPTLIVFNQPISFETKLSSKVHSWLHVTDNNHFLEKISDITCKYTDMTNLDLIELAIDLNLSSFIDKDLSDDNTIHYIDTQSVKKDDSFSGIEYTKTDYDHFVKNETDEDKFLSILKSYSNFTPNHIFSLQPNQIFVFGTNRIGSQRYGAAGTAAKLFGAEFGVTEGPTGRTYALPTKGFSLSTLNTAVEKLLQYVQEHPNLTFLITPIGCGHAGFQVMEVANLFKKFVLLANAMLPESFIEVYRHEYLKHVDTSINQDSAKENPNSIYKIDILKRYDKKLHNLIHYLLDNNIKFSKEEEFSLLDDDGNIIAEAELGLETEKIVFYPYNIQSEIVFKNNGYRICTSDEYLALKND